MSTPNSPMQRRGLRGLLWAAVAGLLAFSGWAAADPPSRVARLGYMSGAVSLSPAGQGEWDQATLNRPLTTGDRLWTEDGARAEVQLGTAIVRMDAATGLSLLNLDDRVTQLQLTQGSVQVRIRRLEPEQVFEVATPNLAFSVREPGEYRIAVEPDGSATTVIVRSGQGEAYGDGASYVIDSRQPYRFSGTDLRDYEALALPRFDDFERWARDRDRRYEASVSARYVSPEVIGAHDLDAHGNWRVDVRYGNVWVPRAVPAGWAPYRHGHWAWIAPWGWTWIDDAPWGFAVSHYGRWAYMQGTWGWVPGPVRVPAVYAPALVAFIGGSNFQLTLSSGPVGGVAWFPLAPREVYRPAYPVSRGYYEQVNRSNTVVNNTVIQNTYNTTNVTNIVYANRKVPGAVVAVPTTAFVQAQPVSKAALTVSNDTLQRAPLANIVAVAPTEQSVRGARTRGDKPPARVFERPVIARTAPPAPRATTAAPQPMEPKPTAAVPTPAVRVVEPPQGAAPTRRPPPAHVRAGATDATEATRPRKTAESAPNPDAAPDATPKPMPEPTARPVPPTPPSEPRATGASPDRNEKRPPESRERPESQGKAAQKPPQLSAPASPPPPPQRPVAAPAPQPAAATPSVEKRPPDSRGRPESQGNAGQKPPQLSAPAPPPPPPRPLAAPAPEPAATPRAPSRAASPNPAMAGPAAATHADATQAAPRGTAKDRGNNGDVPKRDPIERKPKE